MAPQQFREVMRELVVIGERDGRDEVCCVACGHVFATHVRTMRSAEHLDWRGIEECVVDYILCRKCGAGMYWFQEGTGVPPSRRAGQGEGRMSICSGQSGAAVQATRGGSDATAAPRACAKAKLAAYDTVGLFELDEAAARYAEYMGRPEQAGAVREVLHAEIASEEQHLRSVLVAGTPRTSLMWVCAFFAATDAADSSAADSSTAGSIDDDEDAITVRDREPGLFDIDTPYGIDKDDALTQGGLDSENWATLNDDTAEDWVTLGDEGGSLDAVPLSGVLGEFSFSIVGSSVKSDIPAGAAEDQFLAWLWEHHPGLGWLMERLLLDECTPNEIAFEAGVAEYTISRYRTKARQLYEAAHRDAPPGPARVDGRHARSDATQREILTAISRWTAAWGRGPSYRELQKYLGKSMEVIQRNVRALMQQGRVRRHSSGRGLEVVETSESVLDSFATEVL
jgi:hypothetical protein